METSSWTPHVAPDDKPCRHLAYSLSCEEYEELRLHSRAQCQICGIPEQNTAAKLLFIDHDPFTGKWAVRGLLCNRCNCSLESPALAGPQRDAYLAAPWYRRLLLRAGVGLVAPEPAAGTLVRSGRALYLGTPAGWHRVQEKPSAPVRWEQVCRRHGPHRLKTVTPEEVIPHQRRRIPKLPPSE